MKLLFDSNLSFRLVTMLQKEFPGSAHVKDFGLEASGDEVIWNFALKNSYVIVSKDTDFRHWSFMFGAPPKVISVNRGNCSTLDIEQLLTAAHAKIAAFIEDSTEAILILD